MLQESNSLLLDQLSDHIAENGPNRVKSFVGMANVSKPGIIEKYLLHNKYSHRLAQL